ncbi:NAD(P)/FAD-dependent oxidoreductase [Hyphomicrobium sp.]|jgi:cation diffusion facilitator CzcD-associated flavoprotein CzcO|uniref:flavin-containing monooxygenase n=1 Tax=Hyphomicrobium sp. TaxID=82 RepID=UPI002C4296A1|nr:NAD(P)/FAD-dependent oxidoreductase [Hyphomicrobium sp.]HVZ06102.1 NAD(P)/FAD-dependent oxidoreductase [Hyphomicrobium sp.]
MSDRSSTSERHLVIGAGPVGLAMAAALKRRGIPFDVVDAGSGVGGNWLHGVYRSAHIVSSKKATEYTDYPMPADFPDFPSADQMLSYLTAFANDRGLIPHCEFNKSVSAASPEENGRWTVKFVDGEERIYKGVVVCNGHHWDKRYPELRGTFTGEILHSKDYRDVSQVEGKRVLVIGGGNSGVDMACDAGRFGRSCDISLRSGYWYLPKTFLGRPLTDIPLWGLPIFIQRAILKAIVKLSIGDYRRYGLAWPNHKLFDRHPAFGTDLLSAIRLGRVKPRPGIDHVDGQTVTFVDGTTGVYDMIIAATGFHASFPFLPEGLVQVKNNVVQVYGGAFPAGIRGLYLVGWAQARNGFGRLITPLSDLYARMIAMQDELEFPIGTLMERSFTQRLPTTHLVDPEKSRREIRLAHWVLPLLKMRDRRMARKEAFAAEKGRIPLRA